jgi:hypothetical protein
MSSHHGLCGQCLNQSRWQMELQQRRERGFEGLRVRECEVQTCFQASLHAPNGHGQSRCQGSSDSSDKVSPSLSMGRQRGSFEGCGLIDLGNGWNCRILGSKSF